VPPGLLPGAGAAPRPHPLSPSGRLTPVQLTKYDSAGAFVIRDLEDAPCEGPVRLSAKVTQANAKLYARVATYRFALLGQRRGGAAAGIKAEPADKATAISAFIDEVAPLLERRAYLPDPAAGVSADDLAPLRERDPRNPLLWEQVDGRAFRDVAAARSAAACADAHLGGLDGRSVAIQWSRSSPLLIEELHRRGARISAVSTSAGTAVRDLGFGADEVLAAAREHGDDLVAHLGEVEPAEPWAVFGAAADVLVCAPTLRSVSDQGAAMLEAEVVLPSGEQPVAPKALAALRRRDIAVLPDTVALAGPAIVATQPPEVPADDVLAEIDRRVAEVMAASAHADGPLLGSCYVAEEFLRTWQEKLPFGRPLP
jgi:glutamate dehydrogenase (NAD(P)+)